MDKAQYELEQGRYCSNSRKGKGNAPSRMGLRLHRNIIEASSTFKEYGKGLSILDIGCGDGYGMACFKKEGFTDIYGIELVRARADTARVYGLTVFEGIAEDALQIVQNNFEPLRKFNVFCSHVLEHCIDPEKVVEDLKTISNIFWIIFPFEPRGTGNRAHHSPVRNVAQIKKYFDPAEWELKKEDIRRNLEVEGVLGYVKKE